VGPKFDILVLPPKLLDNGNDVFPKLVFEKLNPVEEFEPKLFKLKVEPPFEEEVLVFQNDPVSEPPNDGSEVPKFEFVALPKFEPRKLDAVENPKPDEELVEPSGNDGALLVFEKLLKIPLLLGALLSRLKENPEEAGNIEPVLEAVLPKPNPLFVLLLNELAPKELVVLLPKEKLLPKVPPPKVGVEPIFEFPKLKLEGLLSLDAEKPNPPVEEAPKLNAVLVDVVEAPKMGLPRVVPKLEVGVAPPKELPRVLLGNVPFCFW